MKSPTETGGAIRVDLSGTDDRQTTKSESLQQYRVTCSEFRAFSKSTLVGFATIVIDPPGLVIQSCTVHSKGDRRWLNFPSKQHTGEDGVARWQNLISVEGKAEYWQFQNLALAAIDRYLGDAGVVIEQLTPEQRRHMGEITRPLVAP